MPKSSSSNNRVQANAYVVPEVDRAIQEIAIIEDRTRSRVLEKLIIRGLAAYRRDGQLDEPKKPAGGQASYGHTPPHDRTDDSDSLPPSTHFKEALQSLSGETEPKKGKKGK